MQKFDSRMNLAEEVANVLRDMILDGRLPAGDRINEVQLAAEIGVSRTPVREALSRLVNEGALDEVPRHGFFVRRLTAEEFQQIYPMRAILDPAALRLAGIPSEKTIAKLRELNGKFARSPSRSVAVRLDEEFHLQLLNHCSNRILVDLIRQFMWRTRRYELALMGRFEGVSASAEAHQQIIEALAAGDLERACGALETNMRQGEQPILSWLTQSKAREGSEV